MDQIPPVPDPTVNHETEAFEERPPASPERIESLVIQTSVPDEPAVFVRLRVTYEDLRALIAATESLDLEADPHEELETLGEVSVRRAASAAETQYMSSIALPEQAVAGEAAPTGPVRREVTQEGAMEPKIRWTTDVEVSSGLLADRQLAMFEAAEPERLTTYGIRARVLRRAALLMAPAADIPELFARYADHVGGLALEVLEHGVAMHGPDSIVVCRDIAAAFSREDLEPYLLSEDAEVRQRAIVLLPKFAPREERAPSTTRSQNPGAR